MQEVLDKITGNTSRQTDMEDKISSLRKELDEANRAMVELENKLKFKEETAAAAMAARDAAEKSLKLADTRSSRLRERLEELNKQLEESDTRTESVNRNGHSLQVPTSTSARGLEEAKIRKLPRRLEERTVQALIHASDSPLSIVLVGVGNGPWDDLFMDFTEIMSRETSQGDKEGKFTLEALMKIPAQHDAIISQNIRNKFILLYE
ncbi:E3 ubiquitin-protein ligase RGLG2 [Zea mays]|uniref:E3 ubiquitin-protein ligase RGLG2 n=1 Tax=Zea mays TaxID=4577 RepID=A0A3L6FQF4_MAIZE|nr:E3 ubiquitin-protein ligase RGLG2 [Zea mays]